MTYDYESIVHEFYEELKPLFVNFLRKNFTLDYDEIMYIYTEVWLGVLDNIRKGTVKKGTKWKSYILRMGWNQACNYATRRPPVDYVIDDEKFDRQEFEKENIKRRESNTSVYEDPELKEILANELSTIPSPCDKILNMYYFQNLSMKEIADAMNYASSRSVITTKQRCFERLKKRVRTTARRFDIIE